MATMHEGHCVFLRALPAYTDPSTILREKKNRLLMAVRLKNYVTSLVFSYQRLLVSIVRAKEFQEVSRKTCYIITSGRYLHYIVFCNVPYILECNPRPNIIRTSFCRFIKQKKLFRGSNPQLLQKSRVGCRLHGKPSRRALSSDLSRSVA